MFYNKQRLYTLLQRIYTNPLFNVSILQLHMHIVINIFQKAYSCIYVLLN